MIRLGDDVRYLVELIYWLEFGLEKVLGCYIYTYT